MAGLDNEVSAVASPKPDGPGLAAGRCSAPWVAPILMQRGDNPGVNTFLTILLYLVAASVLLAFIYTLKSLRLQKRFKRLGALRGRSLDEIIKFAGKPSHRARLDSQHEVLEWRRVGFHLALRFTNGVCDGVENVAAP